MSSFAINKTDVIAAFNDPTAANSSSTTISAFAVYACTAAGSIEASKLSLILHNSNILFSTLAWRKVDTGKLSRNLNANDAVISIVCFRFGPWDTYLGLGFNPFNIYVRQQGRCIFLFGSGMTWLQSRSRQTPNTRIIRLSRDSSINTSAYTCLNSAATADAEIYWVVWTDPLAAYLSTGSRSRIQGLCVPPFHPDRAGIVFLE